MLYIEVSSDKVGEEKSKLSEFIYNALRKAGVDCTLKTTGSLPTFGTVDRISVPDIGPLADKVDGIQGAAERGFKGEGG